MNIRIQWIDNNDSLLFSIYFFFRFISFRQIKLYWIEKDGLMFGYCTRYTTVTTYYLQFAKLKLIIFEGKIFKMETQKVTTAGKQAMAYSCGFIVSFFSVLNFLSNVRHIYWMRDIVEYIYDKKKEKKLSPSSPVPDSMRCNSLN